MISIWLTMVLLAEPLSCPEGTTLRVESIEQACVNERGAEHGPVEVRDGEVLLRRARYAHGKLEADQWWRPDGKPKSVQSWSAGKRQGVWENFYLTGTLAWRRVFERDRLVTETLFDHDGTSQKPPLRDLPTEGKALAGG